MLHNFVVFVAKTFWAFIGQVLTIFQAGPGQRGGAFFSLLSSSSTLPETFRLLSFICSFAFKMTSFYFQLQSL